MKQFSQKIMICPVNLLPDTIEPPYTGFDLLFSNIDIDPDVKESHERAGSLFRFSLRAIFPDEYKSILDKYKNRRSFVLILFDTDGPGYQVGNANTPVRTTISPKQFVYELQMTASLLSHPF